MQLSQARFSAAYLLARYTQPATLIDSNPRARAGVALAQQKREEVRLPQLIGLGALEASHQQSIALVTSSTALA